MPNMWITRTDMCSKREIYRTRGRYKQTPNQERQIKANEKKRNKPTTAAAAVKTTQPTTAMVVATAEH